MSRKPPLTPDQVKARFRARGQTLTAWALEHGYSRQTVYRVLNGQLKARFGEAHEIAVKLGLKVEQPDADASLAGCTTYAIAQPSTQAAERNPQRRAFG